MKINFVISIVMMLFCMILFMVNIGGMTFAHSPSVMGLEFDLGNATLDVTITHFVPNPDNHYIYKIEIEKNDILYSSPQYTSQPSSSTFTYSLELNAAKTDRLTVTAFCNQGGSITKTLIINGENGNNEGGGNTPGFEMVLIVGGIVTVVLLKKK